MSPEAANLQVRTRRGDPAARGRRASPLALPDASGVPAPAASPAVAYDTVLVILLGIVGLSALTGYLDYVLIPALAICIGLTIYAIWRKRKADACCASTGAGENK